MATTAQLAWLSVGHAVLGVVAVLAVYRMMEIQYGLGLLTAGLLAVGVPAVEYVVGDWLFNPTVAGMKLMIIVSVAGAAIGVLFAVWMFEPEFDRVSVSSDPELGQEGI